MFDRIVKSEFIAKSCAAVVGVFGMFFSAGCATSNTEPKGSTSYYSDATTQPVPMKRPFMFSEADLPKGFPPVGPVNVVIVKEYPAYRAAVVKTSSTIKNDNGMFRLLFNHIKSNDIAMSAPVDVTYSPEDSKANSTEAKPASMAFIYGDPSIGKTGSDGAVEVVDVPPATVVSVGLKGSYNAENLQKGLKLLNEFLSNNGTYKVVGPPRYLGYNSPFVPWFMRMGEVQLPVVSDKK